MVDKNFFLVTGILALDITNVYNNIIACCKKQQIVVSGQSNSGANLTYLFLLVTNLNLRGYWSESNQWVDGAETVRSFKIFEYIIKRFLRGKEIWYPYDNLWDQRHYDAHNVFNKMKTEKYEARRYERPSMKPAIFTLTLTTW